MRLQRFLTRILTPIGVLIFLALCLVPSGQAQTQPSFAAGVPYQLGIGFNFTSASTQTGAFLTGGIAYYTLQWVPTGTVSSCTLTVDGASAAGGSFSTGSLVSSQTCTSAGSFTTSSASFALYGKVTPTVTGSGSVSVFLFGFVNNPGSAGSSNASIISPVDGSGYVNVDCKTGCGGNPNGSALSANSAPVVIASDQAAVAVKQATGTNLHAVLDSTSTTAVTQATGTNLHAVLDSTSTTAVTQATGTNLHAVLDTTSTTAVTQATGTNLHMVEDATSTNASQMTGTTPGTAPSNTTIVGTISNTAAPAPTTGQTLPLQSDSAGSIYTAFRSSTNGCVSNNGSYNSINVNASTTSAVQLIALSAGKKIYVCSFIVIGGGTSPTLSLVYGTGSNCATGQTVLMGAIPLSTTTPFASPFQIGVTAAANALCTLLTGTSPTAVGVLSYVQ